MESGGGSRRRRSHSGEKLDSANLRDFLRVKEDDDGRNSYSGLTLSAVLGSEKRPSPAQVNRTLLDIIRDDPNSSKESKKSWKAFKDKLRLRRAGAAWTSTIPIPTSDVPFQNTNRMILSRRQSTRFPTTVVNSDDPTSESTHPEISSSSSINEGDNRAELNSIPSNRAMMLRHNSSRIPSLAANRYGRGSDGSTSSNTRESGVFENAGPHRRVRYMEEEDEEEEEAEEAAVESDESAEGAEEGGEPPVRMSLMALLAETDREMGLDESTYTMDDEEEEEEEEEQRELESGGGGEYNNCCVCMVRHKGSAFIPCGHTFCRLCSRELWVQRGNCPLCNGFILEILDIF